MASNQLVNLAGSLFQTLASVLLHPSCRCMESFPVYWSTIIMIILLFAISQMTERNTFSPFTCLLVIVAEIHWKPLIPITAINLCANWNKHCLMSKMTNSWQTGRLFCSGKGRSSAIGSTQMVQAVGKRREKSWAPTAVLSTRVTVSASFTKASGELSYFRMVNVFFLSLFRRNITKINIHRAQRSWSVGNESSALWTQKLTFSNLVDAERKWEKLNGFTLAHSGSCTGSCFRKHFVKISICETSLQTLYT